MYRHPGSFPAFRYVVKKISGFFSTQCGSYSKIASSTQILTFRTLAPFLSLPCPDTNMNPYTTTPQLPSIALVTGGYQFSRSRTNQKRHKTHDSFSLIWPLATKIFTCTAVSFPTGMQPPRLLHRPGGGQNGISSSPTRHGGSSSCSYIIHSRFCKYIFLVLIVFYLHSFKVGSS